MSTFEPSETKTFEDGEFRPQPYRFRVQHPDRGPVVRSPPFHVLLDHTVAILWNLFNKPSSLNDVGHLQWAKYFLQRIRNHHGEMPPDVQLCVETIETQMLSRYADLCLKPGYAHPTCCREDAHKVCQAKQSVTFTEMMKDKPSTVQQLFCAQPTATCSSCSSHLACDCATSKEEMAKFLKQQRLAQQQKVKAEMERLKEIERYLENIDDETQSTGLTDSLIMRIENLKQKS